MRSKLGTDTVTRERIPFASTLMAREGYPLRGFQLGGASIRLREAPASRTYTAIIDNYLHLCSMKKERNISLYTLA